MKKWNEKLTFAIPKRCVFGSFLFWAVFVMFSRPVSSFFISFVFRNLWLLKWQYRSDRYKSLQMISLCRDTNSRPLGLQQFNKRLDQLSLATHRDSMTYWSFGITVCIFQHTSSTVQLCQTDTSSLLNWQYLYTPSTVQSLPSLRPDHHPLTGCRLL